MREEVGYFEHVLPRSQCGDIPEPELGGQRGQSGEGLWRPGTQTQVDAHNLPRRPAMQTQVDAQNSLFACLQESSIPTFRCEACGQFGARQQTTLGDLPPFLIVHVNKP